MADTDLLQVLIGTVDKVKANTDRLMPAKPRSWDDNPSSAGYVPRPPDEAPATKVRPELDQFYASFDELRSTITDVAGKVGIILTDPALVPAQREKNAGELLNAAKASTAANIAAMRTAAAAIVATLTPLAMPQKPAIADAQHAELARLESRIRMVLDALQADAVIPRLERFLREAVVAGDELSTWHLAASGWPQLYLETRGLAAYGGAWGEKASSITGGLLLGTEAVAARQLLDAVVNSDYNLETVVFAAEHYIRAGFDRISTRSR